MKKRLLGVLILTFLIGGGSLFTLAQGVSQGSQNFNLKNGVVGKWNQPTQTLSIEGNGKIDKAQWQSLTALLDLTNARAEEVKINF